MVIRYSVLAVRLLANMFGGHLGLAIIVGFIPAVAGSLLWYGVTPMTVFGATAISMLELFVAFFRRTFLPSWRPCLLAWRFISIRRCQ